MSEHMTATLTLLTPRGRPWLLEFSPGQLTLRASPDDGGRLIPRDAVGDAIDLVRLFHPRRPVLSFRGVPGAGFLLPADQAATLRSWLGPLGVSDLRCTLQRRFRYSLVTGVAVCALAVPPLAATFSPVTLALGLALLFQALAARRFPHPGQFLLESVWWLLGALRICFALYSGASWFWLLLLGLVVVYATTALRAFGLFRGVSPPSKGGPST